MKTSATPADSEYSVPGDVQLNGRSKSVDSLALEVEEAPLSVPLHPLGIKPLGNQYTATSNARHVIGSFQILPDEILVVTLEYLDSYELRLVGLTCKFLYAFCRSEDLWKALFIE